MSAVTTEIVGTDVKISWSLSDDNGSPLTSYKILFIDNSNVRTEYSTCYGNDTTIFTNKYCLVPMSVFYGYNYNLVKGTLIQALVRATNAYGNGPYSSANTVGAKVETAPSAVTPAPAKATGTNNTYIVITWTDLSGSSTGSTTRELDVTYTVYGRLNGTTSWVTLTTGLVDTSYSTTSGDGLTITEGYTYQYYIVATNMYDSGTGSDIGYVKASTTPDVVPNVQTLDSNIYVQIDFDAAPDRGESITGYDILILQSSTEGGKYITDVTY